MRRVARGSRQHRQHKTTRHDARHGAFVAGARVRARASVQPTSASKAGELQHPRSMHRDDDAARAWRMHNLRGLHSDNVRHPQRCRRRCQDEMKIVRTKHTHQQGSTPDNRKAEVNPTPQRKEDRGRRTARKRRAERRACVRIRVQRWGRRKREASDRC
jgi:hypothetical protein